MLTAGEAYGANGVKVSLFGGLAIARVGKPEFSGDGVARAASPLDLLAAKLKVLSQRAERKHDLDVAKRLCGSLSPVPQPL